MSQSKNEKFNLENASVEKVYDKLHFERSLSNLYYQLAQTFIISLVIILLLDQLDKSGTIYSSNILNMTIIIALGMRIFQISILFFNDEINLSFFKTPDAKSMFNKMVFTILITAIIVAISIIVLSIYQPNNNWFLWGIIPLFLGTQTVIIAKRSKHQPTLFVGFSQMILASLVFFTTNYSEIVLFILSLTYYFGNLFTLKEIRKIYSDI